MSNNQTQGASIEAERAYKSWQNEQPNRCWVAPWHMLTDAQRAEWVAEVQAARRTPAVAAGAGDLPAGDVWNLGPFEMPTAYSAKLVKQIVAAAIAADRAQRKQVALQEMIDIRQEIEAGAASRIKTWQERTGNHNVRPGSVKHMLAEIADLRAQLAAAQVDAERVRIEAYKVGCRDGAAPASAQPTESVANWLRRNANAEKDPAKRAVLIEAYNAALQIIRDAGAQPADLNSSNNSSSSTGAQPADGTPLAELWIHEDMDRDAMEAALNSSRKELKDAHRKAVDDLIYWKRRALTVEAGAQPDQRESAAAESGFALAWKQALSDAAFYVAGHCDNGEHHAEIIMEMTAPKMTYVVDQSPAAQPVAKDEPRWDDNGDPWNDAAVEVERALSGQDSANNSAEGEKNG